MKESLYIKRNTAIINFTEDFVRSTDELVSSDSFYTFLLTYLDHLKGTQNETYQVLTDNRTDEETVFDMISLLGEIRVKPLERIDHRLMYIPRLMENLVEDAYNFWRELQRCSVVYLKSNLVDFIELDSVYNAIILTFYRSIEEKLAGRKNKVYRQLKAGTNASVSLRIFDWDIPEEYEGLKEVYSVDKVLLHAPLILHPKTNKREGFFEEAKENPLKGLKLDPTEFYCYPAKIGTLLAMVYFHRDFMFSGLSLANLFEMATMEEVKQSKVDIVVAFGVEDGSKDMCFYHDKKNEMIVAKIAYQPQIEYFGYMKKIMLTAYNVAMMNKGWLPIHGAMVNVTFKTGKKVGVVFMGDSGAGKSETLEELTSIGNDKIAKMEVVFDDMGSFHVKDRVLAQGTEIGAFVRLDDLDRGLPYKEMDRSIFMNPESSVNARVIVPATTFEVVSSSHPVDFFLYANNYEDRIGVELFDCPEDGKQVFIDGKRMAKGTTQEVGLTTSFFANPFGPYQQEALCRTIIDDVFVALKDSQVKVGQVFTNLGVSGHQTDALKQSALALLELIEK